MSFRLCAAAGAVWLATIGATAAGRPPLWIELGPTNRGTGLVVPSAGDGENVPVDLDGRPARRIQGPRSRYMYVRLDHPDWRRGPVDAWLTIEARHDDVGQVGVQYDRAEPNGARDAYGTVPHSAWTLGGGWRRMVFPLPRMSLRGGQNQGADLRIARPGLAVRRIELSDAPPPPGDPLPALPSWMASRRPPGIELTFGNDAGPDDARVYRHLTVTSVESYVDWAGVEPEPSRWDWSKWDAQVEILERAGLKWVPFLIAGPAYATPLWFQQSPDSLFFVCLEHRRESRVQSIFNPALPRQVDRFLEAFARRYRDRGVIESVLLGVTGIYGESLYPAGPEGGWTARLTGTYHNHHGWWAGDRAAADAFRSAMRRAYGDIGALNRAWSTSHASFDAVEPFHPDRAPNDRARADFVEWYQQAMTDWAVLWVRLARRHFPDTPIYLCTGGDGAPVLGADFTAQAAAIAPLRAGIRITNEGSDYSHNFTLTREVATATRLYGTFCGFEPAGGVTPEGNVARIYNASASGARQLHCYADNVTREGRRSMELFARWLPCLQPRSPRRDGAIYLPRESWALEPEAHGRLRRLAVVVRDVADPDFLTRRSVADGGLRGLRWLLLAHAPVLEPDAARRIREWVDAGGTLIVATRPGQALGGRLFEPPEWTRGALAPPDRAPALLATRWEGPPPARWVLDLGTKGDDIWLEGDWHEPEERPGGRTCRWTGARADVLLPAAGGAPRRLVVEMHIPRHAIASGPVRLSVDGRDVALVGVPGATNVTVDVPAPAAPRPLTRLAIACAAWSPAETSGSSDRRRLGVEVRRIEWARADAGPAATPSAPSARPTREVDAAALAACTRRVGGGRIVWLSDLSDRPDDVARILTALLPDAPDRALDGRYATTTTDGILWFEAAAGEIRLEPSP